jgi:rod shape-determining protein MreC
MDFHDKKVIPPKYIYLFMAFICFVLLFFSVIFESRFSPLKAVTSAVITPMQSGVNEVGSSIYNSVSNQKEKNALIEENKKLTEQLAEYSAQIKVYEQENYELKRLQELLNLKEQYVDYNTIGARVIATDSTNWFYTFVIDKGSEDGVKVGCNILAGNGLAGIVTEAGSNYAKVRSIIDDNSNVSANISGTETLCTVSGDLSLMKEGYINVGYINKMDTIEEGAELVTSHVSDKFLPGLLIGYITDVQMDANNLTKSAKCIPVVDFNNLQEVLVILDLKADYNTNSDNKNIYDSIQSTEDTTTEQSSTEGTSQDNDPGTGDNTTEEESTNDLEGNNNPDNTSESQTEQGN